MPVAPTVSTLSDFPLSPVDRLPTVGAGSRSEPSGDGSPSVDFLAGSCLPPVEL